MTMTGSGNFTANSQNLAASLAESRMCAWLDYNLARVAATLPARTRAEIAANIR